MKTWIISITAAVIITTIISFILPEGKMGKYIKSIFSLLIVFTIIKPIIYIKNTDFSFQNFFIQDNFELQYGFINYISEEKMVEQEKYCIKILEEIGVKNSNIDINYCLDDDLNITIELVYVDLKNSVINSDKEHIDIVKEIKQKISSYLNIKENLVKING